MHTQHTRTGTKNNHTQYTHGRGTHHTWLKSPNAIAGPSVRAGFIDPPVYGPSANMPIVYARPTASGAALSAMLRSRSTTVANVTSPKISVEMNSRMNTCACKQHEHHIRSIRALLEQTPQSAGADATGLQPFQ